MYVPASCEQLLCADLIREEVVATVRVSGGTAETRRLLQQTTEEGKLREKSSQILSGTTETDERMIVYTHVAVPDSNSALTSNGY